MRLEDFRFKAGSKLRTSTGTPIMVIERCASMRRMDETPYPENIAVVSLETGRTFFEHMDEEVRLYEQENAND
jgi:hypothetical protein